MNLFGTDGIRGTANVYPMTAELALKLGAALGTMFRNGGDNGHRILIGKDTRLSGYMLESALTAGLTSMGMNVLLVGPMPTPAIAFLTRALRCDAGVMLSASHNPAIDNGIKIFNHQGAKLSKNEENKLEELLKNPKPLIEAGLIGRAKRIDDAAGRYAEHLKARVPQGTRFDGLRVVVDAGNGAAYKMAKNVLWELGAEVVSIGDTPNGLNINQDVGSTHPHTAAQKVKETRADLGLCLDGDADRLIIIDNKGNTIDGDQLLAVLAMESKNNQTLQGPVVGTVMSNIGLETFLTNEGIAFLRAPVGDKHIVERMRKEGSTLGGETSGHIIIGQHSSTGDGILAGLQLMAALKASKQSAYDFFNRFTPAPQILINVAVPRGSKPHEEETVRHVIEEEEAMLKTHQSRLLVRASGTEPLIRVMTEGPNKELIQQSAERIVKAIEQVK